MNIDTYVWALYKTIKTNVLMSEHMWSQQRPLLTSQRDLIENNVLALLQLKQFMSHIG